MQIINRREEKKVASGKTKAKKIATVKETGDGDRETVEAEKHYRKKPKVPMATAHF